MHIKKILKIQDGGIAAILIVSSGTFVCNHL